MGKGVLVPRDLGAKLAGTALFHNLFQFLHEFVAEAGALKVGIDSDDVEHGGAPVFTKLPGLEAGDDVTIQPVTINGAEGDEIVGEIERGLQAFFEEPAP